MKDHLFKPKKNPKTTIYAQKFAYDAWIVIDDLMKIWGCSRREVVNTLLEPTIKQIYSAIAHGKHVIHLRHKFIIGKWDHSSIKKEERWEAEDDKTKSQNKRRINQSIQFNSNPEES